MAVKAAAAYDGPVYIRVGRDSTPALFDETYPFEIGVPVMHRTGNNVTLVSCGLVTAEVLTAAEELAQSGINADVIEVHTLKPMLKPEIILESAVKTKHIITVEEHNVIGGLGTVASEILAGKGDFRLKKLGLQDTFAESGTPDELLEKYGLKASNIVKATQDVLQQ
jgi:transketolase